MAVMEKSWAFDLNRARTPATALEMAQYHMWYIAAFLTGNIGGMASGLWTLFASSDSVTAGIDTTDRWKLITGFDATKIVYANSGAHSWIVLKSPTINSGNVYLTLDYSGTSNLNHRLCLSFAVPTGGSTSFRTTATDDIAPTTNATYNWGNIGIATNDNTTGQRNLSGALASDGSFHILTAKNASGALSYAFIFNVIGHTRTGDLYPWVAFCSYNATSVLTFISTHTGLLNGGGAATLMGYREHGFASGIVESGGILTPIWYSSSTPTNIHTTWGVNVEARASTVTDFPAWVFAPTSTSTSQNGLKGRLVDYALASSGIANNTTDPSGGPVSCVKIDYFWLPSNGILTL